jgi:PIN domain nuclease of toxin-antitoxin system
MKLLLDTHILLWMVRESHRLSPEARTLLGDVGNELHFSAASLWEVAIKQLQGRPDFSHDARLLRRRLLENAFQELPITGAHESIMLVTADPIVARYPAPVRRV